MTNKDLLELSTSGALVLIDSTVFPVEKLDYAIENIDLIKNEICGIEKANKKLFTQFTISNQPPLPNTPAYNAFVEAINAYLENEREPKWSRFIQEEDIKRSGKLTPMMLRAIRACNIIISL